MPESRRRLSALWLLAVVGLALALVPSTTARAETKNNPQLSGGCQIAVMPLKAQGIPRQESHVVNILTDTMATEIAQATSCRVITESDIKSMIDYEATKAACGVDGDNCLAEIGDALGVDLITAGNVGKLGNVYTLNIRLLDIQQAAVVSRAESAVKNDPALLRRGAQNTARALFSLPPLEENDVIQEKSPLARAALWGGLALSGVGAAVTLFGFGTGFASWYYTQQPGGDGNLKLVALQANPVLYLVGAVGTVVMVTGLGAAVVGAALE